MIRPLRSMATLSANHFSTASKRSRSQQSSPAPLESPPVPKATKTADSEEKTKIPAFLRQSKARKLTPSDRFVHRRDYAYAANVLKIDRVRDQRQVSRAELARENPYCPREERSRVQMGSRRESSGATEEPLPRCPTLGQVAHPPEGR